MNQFLLYVVQSGLCLSLFYGLYLLLLRREALFRFNRNILLAIMITSMAIPLIRMPVAEPALIQLPVMQLEEAVERVSGFRFQVSSLENSDYMIFTKLAEGEPETINLKPETINFFPLTYLAGFFVSLALALVSFISVARIIVTARRVVYRRQRILVSPFQISSFTFAGWIVLSEMDYERFAAEIITHETIHRRCGHFWDLCLVNAIAVVHWFNPLAWLLRREVKTQHEYETDRCTLTQGIHATRYKLLLIEKAAGASRYSVASGFAQSKIKKRIVMMNKQNPNPWARWKALLFIPLAALLALAFARPEINRELEQISTLKSTENLQTNTVWNEEKFLEELRMCLPEGVSRELSYEDTWKEILIKYKFLNMGNLNRGQGMKLMMNKIGTIMAEVDQKAPNRIIINDVPDLLSKNLTANKESNFFKNIVSETINGKEVDKIIRYTLIQRDMNTPSEDYQKMYQTVGEAYMQKRDEIARQYYQTGYSALDAEKKSVIDDVVPILVMIEVRNTPQRTIAAIAQPEVVRQPTEEEWKKAAEENRQQKKELQIVIDFSVPNVFKPNLETEPSNLISEVSNKNNLFFPSGITNPRKYHFAIFNRWGHLLFETTEPKKGWNGYFENRLCDEGVYLYKIEGVFDNGQPFSKIGDVTLSHTSSSPFTEEVRNKIFDEIFRITFRQITLNGKIIRVNDIKSLLPDQGKISTYIPSPNFAGIYDTIEMRWKLDSYFILNEQWVKGADVDLSKILNINTYPADEAVKRYGSNAKSGVLAITTQ